MVVPAGARGFLLLDAVAGLVNGGRSGGVCLGFLGRRGGARRGAGRKPTGNLTKQVRLSPATIRKLSRFQKRKGLATFSEAVTAAAELV